jgi:hypothetical protein
VVCASDYADHHRHFLQTGDEVGVSAGDVGMALIRRNLRNHARRDYQWRQSLVAAAVAGLDARRSGSVSAGLGIGDSVTVIAHLLPRIDL